MLNNKKLSCQQFHYQKQMPYQNTLLYCVFHECVAVTESWPLMLTLFFVCVCVCVYGLAGMYWGMSR